MANRSRQTDGNTPTDATATTGRSRSEGKPGPVRHEGGPAEASASSPDSRANTSLNPEESVTYYSALALDFML